MNPQKYAAELIGTFWLTFGGCGSAVLAAAGPGAEVVPVLGDGQADLGALERMLGAGPPALVCLMAANNETGVVHPIAEAALPESHS